MHKRIVVIALGVSLLIILSTIPMWPLWVEGRQFTQTGESLYHEWQWVSVVDYLSYSKYAQTAWQDATKVVYALLAILNPLVLISLAWLGARTLAKLFGRMRS